MPSRNDESERRIERIRKKLDLLSSVLNDLASRMKEIAARQESTYDGLDPPGADPTAELLEILRKKAERAKEVSRMPIRFDESCGVPKFRYAQYVEFRDVQEFLRFRDLPAINRDELEGVDWDDLERRLQEEE